MTNRTASVALAGDHYRGGPVEPKILLDPVDFDALHLSALAFGGIGGWQSFKDGVPWCVMGHAQWLDGVEPTDPNQLCSYQGGYSAPLTNRFAKGNVLQERNDAHISRGYGSRIPFEDYIKSINIDVREVA